MEMAEAIGTIAGWLIQKAGKILLFIAWFQIIKEYFFMLAMLEPKENFCGEEADELQQDGNDLSGMRGGIGNGVEGFQVRDKRFFRLFLWFFTNMLLVVLLNCVLS